MVTALSGPVLLYCTPTQLRVKDLCRKRIKFRTRLQANERLVFMPPGNMGLTMMSDDDILSAVLVSLGQIKVSL